MEDTHIRAVARAFSVLRLMNTAQRWTLHELHQKMALPKTTLFRILSTLQAEGYVQVDVARGQYALTRKVRELSDGYTEKAEIIAVAAPIAIRVTREIKWPLAIGVREHDGLVVGFSTMPYSPVAVHTTTVGHRLSLDNSAMGLAYLAWCSPQERSIVMDLVHASATNPDVARALLESKIAKVVTQGWAVRQPSMASDSATLAVPICLGNAAIAAVGITTYGKLMTRSTIERLLPSLLETADEISASFYHRDGDAISRAN
ncbi:IclR family transcriptional regulator domain-containing protein [Paraburkholderia unamae]|uniref:Helix-turn-helix domain-containing protein n=1 Tax=Paraburkholderia unamae TaxID=219649 RepID=A0ACC6RFD1_9BURK